MAKKSKGEIHAELYYECCARFVEQARRGEYDEAIDTALESLEFVPVVATYLGKTAGEVPRFESIDFILKYSPLFLHQRSLDILSDFLKSKRSVARKLPHDALGELELACCQILDAHRAWNYLVTRESVSESELCQALGEPRDQWTWVTSNWEQLGLLLRDSESQPNRLRLIGSFSQRVRGKCPFCGAMGTGGLYKLLAEIKCPRCQRPSRYVIVSLQA